MQKSHYKQLLHERGICVVIPTYNNVNTILDVVKRTLIQCDDVIVVNDGCTDGTAELLREISSITLVDYEKNEGKGTALKRGFKKAKEMGFSYAITLDADGQHYPEDIPLLLEANLKHPGCIIVGERKMDGMERSKGSKFANSFSNFWFCVQTCHYLPDTQTGYRLYPLRKLHGLSLLTSRYEAELELLVFSSWHGVKIVSVPINVYYPPMEQRVSHFRPGPDFARISVLNTILCCLAVTYGLPWAIFRFCRTFIYTLVSLVVYLIGSLGIITPFSLVYVPLSKVFDWSNEPIHSLLHFFGKMVTWSLQFINVNVTIRNKYKEDFSKPAIIICNHQSHLDLMVHLSLTKKVVFLTNDWVWNSPFFGYVIRHAEYYPVSKGVDYLLPRLKSIIDKGYCISIFPEGTRSMDCSIGRFHKGAFLLAEKLNVDLIPLVLHGAGRALPKKGLYMRREPITLDIDKRITPAEFQCLGETLQDKSKWFRKYYKQRYSQLSNEIEQYV